MKTLRNEKSVEAVSDGYRTIKERREFIIKKLSSGRKIGITWVSKKGDNSCNPSLKNYESKEKNTTAHIPHLMTLWCNKRHRFVNLNLLTIKEVRADKQVYSFK